MGSQDLATALAEADAVIKTIVECANCVPLPRTLALLEARLVVKAGLTPALVKGNREQLFDRVLYWCCQLWGRTSRRKALPDYGPLPAYKGNDLFLTRINWNVQVLVKSQDVENMRTSLSEFINRWPRDGTEEESQRDLSWLKGNKLFIIDCFLACWSALLHPGEPAESISEPLSNPPHFEGGPGATSSASSWLDSGRSTSALDCRSPTPGLFGSSPVGGRGAGSWQDPPSDVRNASKARPSQRARDPGNCGSDRRGGRENDDIDSPRSPVFDSDHGLPQDAEDLPATSGGTNKISLFAVVAAVFLSVSLGLRYSRTRARR